MICAISVSCDCVLSDKSGGLAMRDIEPIAGACAWHGSDMMRSPRWRRRLSRAQLAELDAAIAGALARRVPWEQIDAADFPCSLPPLH